MRGMMIIAAITIMLCGLAPLHAQPRDTPLPGRGAALFVQGIFEQDTFTEGARLFPDRTYTVAEAPAWLRGSTFLRASIDGNLTVTVKQAGVLTVITADPADPLATHSQCTRLEELGFVWVKAPATFQLFGKAAHDISRTYQKLVAQDETFNFPKWTVFAGFSEVTGAAAAVRPSARARRATLQRHRTFNQLAAAHREHDELGADGRAVSDRAAGVDPY